MIFTPLPRFVGPISSPPPDFNLAASELEARLDARPLGHCGPFDLQTRGWVPLGPTGRRLYTVGRHQLIALGVEQKLLPATVIRQVATDRAAQLAEEQGFPVGRKQMRDLRLRVADELRARALVRRRATTAWLDLDQGWLVVDAAGPGRAEEVVETLRETLGQCAATGADTARSARVAMGSWLATGEAGAPFGIDDDVELAGGRRLARHDPPHAPRHRPRAGTPLPGSGLRGHAPRPDLEQADRLRAH
jgi:recombination associated protein RdgC